MVRIIAGSARGRKLETPEGLGTRPTLDRVKEAAFGSLQFAIPGSRVLDLFSGSGSLGLEAVSRGAAFAVLNDHDAACTAIIRNNTDSLGFSENVRILNGDYLSTLEQLDREGESFDIVFLDPPYREDLAQTASEELFRRGMIRPGGTVMIEFGTEMEGPHEVSGLMKVRKVKHYGACSFALLEGDGAS